VPAAKKPALCRRLNLPLLILYGVGVTVGVGIYVLIGTVAAGEAPPAAKAGLCNCNARKLTPGRRCR
jgi:hypothetical protein